MYCKQCGQQLLEGDSAFCQNCGKQQQEVQQEVKSSGLSWVPLIITIVAFLIFGGLGGDYALQEVNVFDYVAGIMGFAALIMSITVIPKEAKGLRITSICISAFMIFSAVGWIMTHGF